MGNLPYAYHCSTFWDTMVNQDRKKKSLFSCISYSDWEDRQYISKQMTVTQQSMWETWAQSLTLGYCFIYIMLLLWTR